MQTVINAASSAATAASQGAAQLANTATGYVQTAIGGHAHSEEHSHKSTLPPDAQVGEVKKMDSEGLQVFESDKVRHEVLVKINHLALDDKKHGLKELASLDLVTDAGKKGIDFYHPLRYLTVHRPIGTDYIGEIEIEDGKCIHVRCHKASSHAEATFHSLDTRPGNEGGAVFKTGDKLGWFDY